MENRYVKYKLKVRLRRQETLDYTMLPNQDEVG